MSYGAVEVTPRTASPGSSLKRKRETTRLQHHGASHKSSSPHANDTATTQRHLNSLTDATGHTLDLMRPAENGDMLGAVGSAGSASSLVSASSTFSSTRHPSLANGLTPLTNHTDSSPAKSNSPFHAMPAGKDDPDSTGVAARTPASQIADRPRMLPPPGKVRGYRAVWDPELDGKLSKEERKRATQRKKEFGTETYDAGPPPDPRLAIPGYMSGICRAKTKPSKAILRVAPYNLAPFKVDANSVGPGEAEQIVVVGFDPFMMDSTLRINFGAYGKISSLQNKTDPTTGSFLGIALIKYRDHMQNGVEIKATAAAKAAEAAFKNGQKLQQQTVRVELDREGRRCKRHVEEALKKIHKERAKLQGSQQVLPSTETPKSAAPSAAPLNAPKGPSASRAKTATAAATATPPTGPGATATPPSAPAAARGGQTSLIEEEPVLSKIKRKPYIFIPNSAVPVLATTIPHLKKRLKAFDWREVRLDKTGYYVIFDDSKRGEDETERCFAGCNNELLFTYHMTMECQKYGNPDYERSPSPERAMAEQQKQALIERLQKEEAEDLEIEKVNRAANLDPVLGALEQLRAELRDKIMGDVKTRIAIPIFHDSLEPSKHVARRRKLGLPDPSENENKVPGLLFRKSNDLSSPHSQKSRHGHGSKPLRPHDPNQQRGRRGERDRGSQNAFIDERRRKPAARPSHTRGLHFRLQQMYEEEEDSEDERHTSVTRDTEDQESRPLSRASRTSTPAESETADTPSKKRRKLAEWDEEEKEQFDKFQQDMLGHLLCKEPEDLATRELELVVNTLPRASKYATRARTELYIRQRSKADDDLFDVVSETKKEAAKIADAAAAAVDVKTLKEKAKKKRKTKKQILEEQEALKLESDAADSASEAVLLPEAVPTVEKIEKVEELEVDEKVDLHLTYDKPRRTVEDDTSLPLDIDGWQEYIKDDEDLMFAKTALAAENPVNLGDVKLWAWRQKDIKELNSIGATGAVPESLIQGYYVPNPTGCARTEGVKKILNEEKSKYLPHRIKVQKAREQRQALLKANPAAAVEAAKIIAAERIVSKATSRSNRVNNRRLVNDINLQKQNLAATSSDADVAIRFNQLKKRKKLVKFDRSAIHGWGLYAEENIAINDLIIEYVGEKVRQKVADMREIRYDKQGVGSSYLFRMLDDEIVDATKKGGIARFINHSCDPNCTAKIIKVEGTPRIVIYALKDIAKNDELTYDYKFEREYGSTDRIPCLCGSANCKGFLN